MISRHWTGLARTEAANDYLRHLQTDTFPRLSRIKGFVGASILSRNARGGVEFLIVTDWDSIEAIREFAGDDPELAVVPEVVQAWMLDYDRNVRHYEIVADYPT